MSIWVHDILKGRPSREVHFVSPVMACFEAVYGKEKGLGTWAEREPLLMMRPPGGAWFLKILNASRVQRNGPVRLTFTTRWNVSRDSSSIGTWGHSFQHC